MIVTARNPEDGSWCSWPVTEDGLVHLLASLNFYGWEEITWTADARKGGG